MSGGWSRDHNEEGVDRSTMRARTHLAATDIYVEAELLDHAPDDIQTPHARRRLERALAPDAHVRETRLRLRLRLRVLAARHLFSNRPQRTRTQRPHQSK